MNNTQFYLSIGIPTLTVILAWLSNRSDINRLNDKVDRMDERLNIKIEAQGGSIRAELEAIRNEHHKDFVLLMSYVVPLHERMAKLESHN